MLENTEDPLKCPFRMHQFYLTKWFVRDQHHRRHHHYHHHHYHHKNKNINRHHHYPRHYYPCYSYHSFLFMTVNYHCNFLSSPHPLHLSTTTSITTPSPSPHHHKHHHSPLTLHFHPYHTFSAGMQRSFYCLPEQKEDGALWFSHNPFSKGALTKVLNRCLVVREIQVANLQQMQIEG